MADNKNSGEINYVSQQRFWSDAYKRELMSQRIVWPRRFTFLVDEYRKINTQLDKGKPLPAKSLRVKEEDFRRFDPDPDKKQPPPISSTRLYGWNIGTGRNRLEPLDRLTRRPSRVTINKQLGWAWGAQD